MLKVFYHRLHIIYVFSSLPMLMSFIYFARNTKIEDDSEHFLTRLKAFLFPFMDIKNAIKPSSSLDVFSLLLLLIIIIMNKNFHYYFYFLMIIVVDLERDIMRRLPFVCMFQNCHVIKFHDAK